jgi:hypothetical protein
MIQRPVFGGNGFHSNCPPVFEFPRKDIRMTALLQEQIDETGLFPRQKRIQ